MGKISIETELVVHECGECHMIFAMTEAFKQACLNDSTKSFYCPAGHVRVFRDGALQRAQKELAQAKMKLQEEEHKRVEAEKKLRREQHRTANGKCPCCDRNFANLSRHMRSKHPEHVKEHNTL